MPTPQAPAVQAAVPLATVQAVPHMPQLPVSLCGLTQRPAQQLLPVMQVVPQAPQFIASDWGLTQAVPQQVEPAPHARPGPQPGTHAPMRHTVPSAQSPSARQPTHIRVAVSQRIPPMQSIGLRHPGTQRFMLQ
jgi:hypothetical protein